MAASTSSPAQLLNSNLQTQLLRSPLKGNCSLRGPQIQARSSSPHLQSPGQALLTLRHTGASIQRATPASLSSFPMLSPGAQALTGYWSPSPPHSPWAVELEQSRIHDLVLMKSLESTTMSHKLFGFSEHQSPTRSSSNGDSPHLIRILRGFDKVVKSASHSAWDAVSAHTWKRCKAEHSSRLRALPA